MLVSFDRPKKKKGDTNIMGNKSGALILLIMLIVSAFVILMVKLAAYIRHFNGETRRIIMKMQRAADEKEYCYWHKMLRCHYLCLIPFVNERNVSGAYSFFFHQPKRAEKETRIDGVFHILAPSLAAFCLCAVCLCGASWAWFTASSGIGAAKVQAATYTVKIEYKTTDTDVWQDGEYQISLDGGKIYTLSIIPNGTATNGYCTVKIGDKTYQTNQIPKGSSSAFSFTVQANEDAILMITPKWGTGPDPGTEKISSGDTIVYGTVQVMSSLSQTRANGSGENSAPSAPAPTGANNVSTNEEGNSVSTNVEGYNAPSPEAENSAQGSTGSAAQEAGAGE